LITAINAIQPSADVTELSTAFDDIEHAARGLSDCMVELTTGRPPAAPRASIDRVAELAAQHGPVAGAVEFARERQAERQSLAQRAQQKAAERGVGQQTKENTTMATDEKALAELAQATMQPTPPLSPRAPRNSHRPDGPDQPNGVIGATFTQADCDHLNRESM
jgi:hypothetical protein